jgi:hypothetical protein
LVGVYAAHFAKPDIGGRKPAVAVFLCYSALGIIGLADPRRESQAVWTLEQMVTVIMCSSAISSGPWPAQVH